MSALTSTVPGAVTALYNLLAAKGQTLTPSPVSVFLDALNEDEPDSYILLGGPTPSGKKLVENYRWDTAALGSGSVYELYEIWGFATVWGGDFDMLGRLDATFALFQSVVVNTFIAYRGGFGAVGYPGAQILGSTAPAALEQMTLDYVDYDSQAKGDGTAGVLEFCVSLKARLTIA